MPSDRTDTTDLPQWRQWGSLRYQGEATRGNYWWIIEIVVKRLRLTIVSRK